MPPKSRSKREQFTPLKNNDSAPSVRTPATGRRLGGGANGGVSSDDPDDLRRVRLAALARQERKVAAAAAQAARKREASASSRAPSHAASLTVNGQAVTRPSDIQSGVDGGSEASRDMTKADEFDDVAEMAAAARSTAGAALADAAAAAAAIKPGQMTSSELLVLATTAQLIVRNARERPDRRSLKAANDGVWTKVVRWPLGRKLLGLAGFSAAPQCPDVSSTGSGDMSNDSAPLTSAEPEVAAWRAVAVYTFQSNNEDKCSSGSSANETAVATAVDTSGTACAAAIEGVLAAWIAQIQGLSAPLATSVIPNRTAATESTTSTGGSRDDGSGGGGGQVGPAPIPVVAGTRPTPPRPPPPQQQQQQHQLLVGGALHGPAGPAVDWLKALGLERYAPRLLELGYDDPSTWVGMTVGELDEMAEESNMLPGHRQKLANAIRNTALLPGNLQTSYGDGSSGGGSGGGGRGAAEEEEGYSRS